MNFFQITDAVETMYSVKYEDEFFQKSAATVMNLSAFASLSFEADALLDCFQTTIFAWSDLTEMLRISA